MRDQQPSSYLIVRQHEMLFALSFGFVKRILIPREILPLPEMPPFVRGLIHTGGKAIPLLDLSLLLDQSEYQEEIESLVSLLHEREEDHRTWLAELELSIREKRPFRLSRNPHRCAFGIWYDSFNADDRHLMAALEKFKAPHNRIHAIAEEALDLAEKGDHQAALEIIEKARDSELHTLIDMFDITRIIIRDRRHRLAVILSQDENELALYVDAVEGLERFDESAFSEPDDLPGRLETCLVSRILQRKEDVKPYYLFEVERLFAGRLMTSGKELR
jgi:chemotaxis signal transduction protein